MLTLSQGDEKMGRRHHLSEWIRQSGDWWPLSQLGVLRADKTFRPLLPIILALRKASSALYCHSRSTLSSLSHLFP